jgi:hypothetical protein
VLSDAGKCLRTQVAGHISAVLLVTFGLSARLGKLSVDCVHLGLDRLVCQGMRTNRRGLSVARASVCTKPSAS